eukprot:gene6223-12836_t
MVEITRLRTEARQMAASVATVESSKLAMEASSRQLQAVAAATHRGELADLQRSLDAAIIKAKDSEASNAAAAESMPAAIAQARREGEAAAELAAADKAREVASAHSIEMLKLSTEPAELRVQLEQEKSNAERLASKYEAEMAQLNQVVERVSAENAKLHDNMLQTSEQKMALMVEHEERIKLGQQQIELTEAAAQSMRAQFVAEVEQLRLKNQAISAGKKREAIKYKESLKVQDEQVRAMQTKALKLEEMLHNANTRAERHTSMVATLEHKAKSAENRARLLEAGLNGLRQQADDVVRTGSLGPEDQPVPVTDALEGMEDIGGGGGGAVQQLGVIYDSSGFWRWKGQRVTFSFNPRIVSKYFARF